MIETSDSDGIRVLRLAHKKASALDLELVVALREALERANADGVRAIVLTGTAHIFCAGVDLYRVVDGGADYVRQYLAAFKPLMFTLLDFPRPLVVAANGHAMAGGAVLVSAGDYRLMASGQGRFGYTELLVGVPFPPAALEIIRLATPPDRVSEMLYTGATFLPEETLARGCVDALAEPSTLMARALEIAQQLGSVPAATFAATKRHIRAPALAMAYQYESKYAEEVTDIWASDATRTGIRAYMDAHVRQR